MSRAIYDYTITVLEKVSFDNQLFKKEVEKAFQTLLAHERLELKIWLQNFLSDKPELRESMAESQLFGGKGLMILTS